MSKTSDTPKTEDGKDRASDKVPASPQPPEKTQEIGGRGGLDPVRYGDWEIGGKCVDF
jgi:hypothetical protein